ncbi:hypothetical protein C8J57DRAFT_1430211 [Mycena rebaudengoi]|nr:hypothetical protein C8J57DRAFT_1430211 [Mycena rebaudengoi]
METLPAELHSLVVELACASPAGGKTPLALSRANSYFHEIAAPFLFYTIVVTSQEQAEQLLLILESTPEHRRRIERLLLAPGVSARAVLRLIHLAAPTLRALAVLTPPTASALLSAIFRTPFPHLTSLSVRGLYPLPRPGAFPVLERLHLAGNRSPAGLLTALRHACPALTDLRVSSLRGAPAFAREVQAAFLAPSKPRRRGHDTAIELP